MGVIIKVYNTGGSFQSVCLYEPVRTDEVLSAITQRQGISAQGALDCVLVVISSSPHDATDGLSSGQGRVCEAKVLELSDRPLEVKRQVEAVSAGNSRAKARTVFVFCRRKEAENISEDGGAALLEGVERAALVSKLKKKEREFLTRTTKLQNGELYAYLLKRSSNNEREWQRRWCVLRRDGLYHCRSKEDQTDIQCIALTHNTIEMNRNPQLSNCFEIHTSQSVEYFRAKTLYECKEWVLSVERNMSLASENEYFMLAEYMIADEERATSLKTKRMLETTTASFQGLLSTSAGIRALVRFAKLQGMAMATKLLLLYVDIQRAKRGLLPANEISAGKVQLLSTRSPKSTVSVSSLGSARLSEPAATPAEWVKRIAVKHNTLIPQHKVCMDLEGVQLCKVLENIQSSVLRMLESSLYKSLCVSEMYTQVLASISSSAAFSC